MPGRSKSPLALMEQTLMALFFALAAAVVLQAFAWCGVSSKGLEREDRCLAAASATCEAVRTGDLGLIGLDGEPVGDFEIELDGCHVSVEYRDEGSYMWVATVTASNGDAAVALEAAGQK